MPSIIRACSHPGPAMLAVVVGRENVLSVTTDSHIARRGVILHSTLSMVRINKQENQLINVVIIKDYHDFFSS